MPTIFECINAHADAIKAAKWAAYQPLTRQQLSDKPRRRDPEQNPETVTLDVGVFGQFVVIKRPTEQAFSRGHQHDDKIVIRRPLGEKRYCIYCKTRHSPSEFIHSPRYLHHLSYACKASLRRARLQPWRYADGLLTRAV